MNHFLLLQINDSQFPIGSYTQSYGLETYVQKGLISSGGEAESFLVAQLQSSLIYSELLSIKMGYSYGISQNLQGLRALEELSLVSRTAKELREASLKLGKRFVKTVEGLPVGFSLDFFREYQEECREIGVSHSVAYGVFCACGGFSLEDVLAHYLYNQISGFVTNCVKLIPLSQTEGQKILCGLQKYFPEVLGKVEKLTEEDLFLSCPALDLHAMEHERLYSRLYMS